MAQFVQPNRQSYVPGTQPSHVHVAQQQPVIVSQQQPVIVSQPQVVYQQQPIVYQQPLQVEQREQYNHGVRKEDNLALKCRKFLFLAPLVFFLVVLAFSTATYTLRFRDSDNTTPLAVDVIENFGKSITIKPYFQIEILSKYKKKDDKTSGLNVCSEVKGKNDKYKGKFETITFNTFQKIEAGCVCRVTKYGIKSLSYHDSDFCEDNLDENCKNALQRDETAENYFLGDLWCGLRVEHFKWRKDGDEKQCKDYKDVKGKALKSCGQQICVNDDANYKDCPYTQIKIKGASAKEEGKGADKEKTINLIKEAKKYKVFYRRSKNNRPVIHLTTSISKTRCLAQNLQIPTRRSSKSYGIQNLKEEGCKPYGSHKYAADTEEKVTYNAGFIDTYSQKDFNKANDVDTKEIPFYDSDVIDGDDFVQQYTEVRPEVKNTNVCRDDKNIENVSEHARNVIDVLQVVEDYSLTLIITCSIGLLVSLLFVVLKARNAVNSTTQLYLHIYTFAIQVVLFVFPILFWNQLNQAEDTEENLRAFEHQGCYKYTGQYTASHHLSRNISTINNEIYGLITFLFVFDIVMFVATVAASVVRSGRQLTVCEPVKGDQYYYEN